MAALRPCEVGQQPTAFSGEGGRLGRPGIAMQKERKMSPLSKPLHFAIAVSLLVSVAAGLFTLSAAVAAPGAPGSAAQSGALQATDGQFPASVTVQDQDYL